MQLLRGIFTRFYRVSTYLVCEILLRSILFPRLFSLNVNTRDGKSEDSLSRYISLKRCLCKRKKIVYRAEKGEKQ